MKRALLIAGLGTVALFGGSAIGILWVTRAPAPAAPPPETAAIAPPPVATEPPPAPTPPARASPARGSGPARAKWKAPAEDPHPIPMADRVTRKSIRKALHAAAVQSRLARCADRELGFGGGAAPGRVTRARPAVLLLELETRPGEVQIVAAHVQSWGGASAHSVSCAQDVLQGRTIKTTTSEAAGRVRMPLPLNPRSGALAPAR